MRFQPVPEKDSAFWDWYEHHHIPDLFTRPGWKRVRMCRLAEESTVPEPLRPYAHQAGQPKFLNLLERYVQDPAMGPPSGAPSRPSSGQMEFIQNWLPHLAHYSTAGYRCVSDKTATGVDGAGENKRPYQIRLTRYDVAPEKDEAFHQWYDGIHAPELFQQQAGWRAVRRFTFAPERGGVLENFQLSGGVPAYLIVLERDLVQRGRAPGPPPQGVHDFVAKWLPHLRNYSIVSYECLVDASDADFKK